MTAPAPCRVVFVGPTLDASAVASRCPGAIVAPPARMGDVLDAVRRWRPHAIGLVDGEFGTSISVLHKELLAALDDGIWVLGSSGLGALRAADCAPLGVRGVGEVYAMVAAGLITDDEVLVAHAGEAQGYRATSDSLVTIRATLGLLAGRGELDDAEAAELVERQRARWFPERSLHHVTDDARRLGLGEARAVALGRSARSSRRDPGREDALALLDELAALPGSRVEPASPPRLVASVAFRATAALDVRAPGGAAGPVLLDDVRRFALLGGDGDELAAAARLRVAATTVSSILWGPLTDEDRASAAARVAQRLGVAVDELHERLATLDLDAAGAEELLDGEAHLERLATSSLASGRPHELARAMLHELRLQGRYDEVKAAAALERATADSSPFPTPPSATAILRTFASLTGWQVPGDLDGYCQDRALGAVVELLDSLAATVAASRALFGTELVEPRDVVEVPPEPHTSRR